MPEYKNQHFVPEHYLKRFGHTNDKKICLIHIPTRKSVFEANIKNQCSENYFYGRDGEIESLLSDFEGKADPLLTQIIT